MTGNALYSIIRAGVKCDGKTIWEGYNRKIIWEDHIERDAETMKLR